MVERPDSLSNRSSSGADVLTDLLETMRLRSSLYSTAELHAPWGMTFAAAQGFVFHVVHEGEGWLHADGRYQLRAGDVVVIRRGLPHALTDQPDTPAGYEVNVNNPANAFRRLRYGDPEEPRTVLLCGLFRWPDTFAHPALRLLPSVLHLRADRGEVEPTLLAVLNVLCREASQARPGRDTIVQRLADTLFVQVLRGWMAAGESRQGWLGALRDRKLSLALAAIHAAPNRAWTVAELAEVAGMSRTAFATRFARLVGEPPLTYLRNWRLQLAALRLRETRAPVGRIAEDLGYDSEGSFSHAFKRTYGVPPGQYRRGAGPA